jgi:hypothetical protein
LEFCSVTASSENINDKALYNPSPEISLVSNRGKGIRKEVQREENKQNIKVRKRRNIEFQKWQRCRFQKPNRIYFARHSAENGGWTWGTGDFVEVN